MTDVVRWVETLTDVAHHIYELRLELAEVEAALIQARYNTAMAERHQRQWEYERAYELSTVTLRVEQTKLKEQLAVFTHAHYVLRAYLEHDIPYTARLNPMPAISDLDH